MAVHRTDERRVAPTDGRPPPLDTVGRPTADRDRRTAKVVGVLFLTATAASILGSALQGSTLDEPLSFAAVSDQQDRLLWAALVFLVAAVSAFATAFLLFPILRRHAEGWAAGYVGLRTFENVFYASSVVAILVIVSVSGSAAGAPPVVGAALIALREWSSVVGTLVFAGLGAIVLNGILFGARLVPRWLSVWGAVGGALVVLYGVMGILGTDVGFDSPALLLAMPLAFQELVFAGWLLTKGLVSRAS